MRAHPSYCLMGDGSVGHKEYFIARKFDKGDKGYLTEEEQQECIKAVKDGYEEKFLFGLDSQAPVGDNKDPELLRVRVQQVKGQLIKGEDYSALSQNNSRATVKSPNEPYRTQAAMYKKRVLEDRKLAEPALEKAFQDFVEYVTKPDIKEET